MASYIDRLVHPCARDDELVRARHQGFIVSHLGSGLLAAAVLVLYLALAGVPGPVELLAFGSLIAPAACAAYLSRSGRLETAFLLSTVCLTVLVTSVAWVTGGVASFLAPWLLVIPFEGALSGSRRVVTVAVGLAAAALCVLIAAGHFGALPSPYRFGDLEALLPPLGLFSAFAYIAGLALGLFELDRRTRGAIARSEARYRLLAENATDLISRHDADGSVKFASGASSSTFGCPPEELYGGRMAALIHAEDRAAFRSAFADASAGGGTSTALFRRAGDSAQRWLELRCSRLDHPSHGASCVAVTRDVTEAMLQQASLEQALRAAEEANAAKTRFLAKVSHELRTPLNAIIGFSEIIEEELSGLAGHEQRKQFAALINESGSHLLNVVNDLMDMSRIEAGNMQLQPEPLQAVDIIATCVDMLRQAADDAGVSLETDFAAEEFEVVADKKACRQIALNLMNNAIKFTPSGGRVAVTVRNADGALELRVCDTGIGIPAAQLADIARPFVQAENGYDRRHDGVGLGLAVVSGLVELHGGRWSIDSVEGEGTSITVVLPPVPVHRGDGAEKAPARDAQPPALRRSA